MIQIGVDGVVQAFDEFAQFVAGSLKKKTVAVDVMMIIKMNGLSQ